MPRMSLLDVASRNTWTSGFESTFHYPVEIVDGKLHNVQFFGGCDGNTQGVSRLVEGMKVEDVLDRLEGIRCGWKTTSCPDQLCKAIREVKSEN